MKNNKLIYFFFILIYTILTACHNRAETTALDKDIFELIEYPKWMDTLNCSRFGTDYKPYPCLELHKKTMQEIDSIYGKPLYMSIDTLYNGMQNSGRYAYDDQDLFITKMLSNVPFAKVTFTHRNDRGYNLDLFFIKHDKQDVVFYGFRLSPDRYVRIYGY